MDGVPESIAVWEVSGWAVFFHSSIDARILGSLLR